MLACFSRSVFGRVVCEIQRILPPMPRIHHPRQEGSKEDKARRSCCNSSGADRIGQHSQRKARREQATARSEFGSVAQDTILGH
jgi:hypothetical protein